MKIHIFVAQSLIFMSRKTFPAFVKTALKALRPQVESVRRRAARLFVVAVFHGIACLNPSIFLC